MMKLAPRLKLHLDAMGIDYDVKRHRRTATSNETAEAAHVPGARLAKAVLLKDSAGPLLAVLASSQHVELERLNRALDRQLELASEADAAEIFFDCAVGALPAAGAVYGVEVVVDRAFGDDDEVYVEAGDHEHVLGLTRASFRRLTRLADRADLTGRGPVADPAPARKATKAKSTKPEVAKTDATKAKAAKPRKKAAPKPTTDGHDGAASA